MKWKLPPGPCVEVECGECHRKQLRWSEDHPSGLRLAELEMIGWVWTGLEWRCPFCFEKEHFS